ncbi:alpha/beta hydrolase [Nonomuraea sp. M3C6]|uniref:Alpha/beta hydrolase n=1 Tax=Nonomuraea marmarensis TaxID=3351344 RepID=A0ABW7AFA6_9ACTN
MAPERIFGFPTRFEGDPDRVAVLLPGGGYMPARPLLHYARAVLKQHGWSVQEIWWEPPTTPGIEDRAEWVLDQARRALDAEKAQQLLLVGKSLGTFAAPLAAERGLPAIWLTPLLTMETVVEGLRRSEAPTLLVGGTADRLWDSETARTLDHPYVEIPGADHGLETGDPVESVEMLKEVTTAMSRFVAGLRP